MPETASGNEFMHDSICITEGAGCGKRRVVCHNGLAATRIGGKKAPESGGREVFQGMVGYPEVYRTQAGRNDRERLIEHRGYLLWKIHHTLDADITGF